MLSQLQPDSRDVVLPAAEEPMGNERRGSRRLWLRLMLRASTKTRFGGLNLAVFGDDAEDKFAKLREACMLIKRTSPWRFSQIERDLDVLFVVYRLGARYVPELRACMLGEEYLTRPAAEIAMTIIHEGTHARLWKCGFGYDVPVRERIERICVRMEVSFARRVPGTEQMIAYALKQLAKPWWNTADVINQGLDQLRAEGVPEVFVRVIGAFARFRQRRQGHSRGARSHDLH